MGSQAEVCTEPEPVEPVAEPVTEPKATPASRITQQLALAYAIERHIESGEVANFAEASRRLGVSRLRMTQIMALIHLPAPVQEAILMGELVDSERKVLAAHRGPDWNASMK